MTLFHFAPASLAATSSGVGHALGWVSVGLLVVTVLFLLGCLIATRAVNGWKKLSYVVIGAIGSWIGCGLGVIVGLIGVAFQQHDNRAAALGVALNLLVGAGPWLAFQIHKAHGRRERTS